MLMKRAFNPKMSHIFNPRKRGPPLELPKRSNPQVNLMNAETLLAGIMQDLDTILEQWKDESPQDNGNGLPNLSREDRATLKEDAAWLRDAIGKICET